MWGSNPFTNYQTMPYGGQSYGGGHGQNTGWGSGNSGSFDSGALNFAGMGGMQGQQGFGNGMGMGYPSMPYGMQQPSWGGMSQGGGQLGLGGYPIMPQGGGMSGGGGLYGGGGMGPQGGGSQGFAPGSGFGQFNNTAQGMPPWMWGMNGMGGGAINNPSGSMNGGSYDPVLNPGGQQGMNPAARGGDYRSTMPQSYAPWMTQAAAGQPAQAAAPNSGPLGVYGNVVHNGSFDSANATLSPMMRSMIQS